MILVDRQGETKSFDWQVPKFDAAPYVRQGWIEENLQEGDGWLEGQDCVRNIARNLNIFDGIFEDRSNSQLITNGLQYDLRKFIETISQIKEIGTYNSENPAFKGYGAMITKLAKYVYTDSGFPGQIRKALQFGVLGRGYIWPKCKAEDYGWGKRHIVFQPLGVLDVVPTQVPESNDTQDSYTQTIFQYMPIAEAHGRFPKFQDQLKPVSAMSYRSRMASRRVDYAERFRAGDMRSWGNLYCEIRYTFIRDLRINDTGHEIPMGEIGTSWFYKVPYVGQWIFNGYQNGVPAMRQATKEDCRVYPYLRLMISCANMAQPMYDGPAFDWHGKMPAVQFDLDDWAWEAMGRSLVQNVGTIEQTKRKHERKMDQVLSTQLNPPLGYDANAIQGPEIEQFDIFRENQRIGLEGQPAQTLQSVLPDSVHVTEAHFKFWQMLMDARREQLGINDVSSLENLKFNLTSDDFNSVLESVGPIAKAIASGMERSNAKIAYMVKFMIPQWMDTKQVIELLGPDNVTKEVFDFDPASLLPGHLPNELVNGNPLSTTSVYSPIERMRYLANNIALTSVPSTLNELTAMQEQLKWLQLKSRGAPLSWATTLTMLGVQNYGEVEGNTEREKFINESLQDLKLKIMAAQIEAQSGLGGPPAQGQSQPAQNSGAGQGKGGGRPPSYHKPPKLEQKGSQGGDPRTVISTSG